MDVFIVLEEDDRKCEDITGRCEFGCMAYGTICNSSVVFRHRKCRIFLDIVSGRDFLQKGRIYFFTYFFLFLLVNTDRQIKEYKASYSHSYNF